MLADGERRGVGMRAPVIRPLDRPGDLGWTVLVHAQLYTSELNWDNSFEALVARIVADYAERHDPEREAAWIAELDGERVGCIFCVTGDDRETAKLRVLLVHPSARGHGVGARLVQTCLDFATEAGYRRITLWTTDQQTTARRIYESVGFELVKEVPQHSFGHDLVGQTWTRGL
jgi:GNAT superfamily N-acetyltransferase